MSKQAWNKKLWCVVATNGSYPPDQDETVYEIHETNEAGCTVVYSHSLTLEDADSIVADHNALLDIADPEAFMAAHDKLVEACEELTNPRVIINAPPKSHDALDKMEAALAAVKEAS